MRIVLIAIFLLGLSASNKCMGQSLYTDEKFDVVFQMHSPDLPDTTGVYITGNIELLANWNPARVRMENIGNHTWEKKISLEKAEVIEYKYTLGSWDKEGAGDNGLSLDNYSVQVAKDTVLSDAVYFWQDGKQKPFQGQITGKLRYHRHMKGEGIQDRDLVVWLPPAYDENPEQHYSVLYMHDGQNLFDPQTSSFGVDWQADEICDSLIRHHKIAPVIVVGIYNTPDRSVEYIPGKKGTAYMNFVVNKVKPFIDANYRTQPDKKHTLVGGSSAGGIISFMLAWEYPNIFSGAICMSPAFKIEDIDYVKTVKVWQGEKKDLFFYIDNGGVGLELKLQAGIDEMLEVLKQKGYKEVDDYIWLHDPQARHSESAWAQRLPKALMFCLPEEN